ncbi:MAG: transposase [Candidatus Aminicenantes bacterium]|nr:transposase [Candidatus Aminicenantes bacterium]
MPRIARVVVPNCPHHITNRGNRRQAIFFGDEDKKLYLRLLLRYGDLFGLKFWAYCLMHNHVHLIAVPLKSDSMNLTIREAHKKYTSQVNLQMNWRGSLWQGRYYSFPLEDIHLYRALRYVENNPVRAGIVKIAENYPWSSASSHVLGKPDDMLSPDGLGIRGKAWRAYLREQEEEEEIKDIRNHIMTGRPLGGEDFINQLENTLGREVRPKKPGRKKHNGSEDDSDNSGIVQAIRGQITQSPNS